MKTITLLNPITQAWFWRLVLLILGFRIIPYELGFGFTDEPENWTWWHKPIIWLGESLFSWGFDLENLYIGFDSKFEFCRYIFLLSAAFIFSILWLLIDKYALKKTYSIKALTQTCLRYYLGITMLHYGLAKVFSYQFGSIDISGLESTFGELSPMGLMWTYLSYSKTVTVFAGWLEAIGAILLFFRKTTFIGAVLTLVAIGNVVLWDIGYGVSVTFYAIFLLILTLILLATQLRSLIDYFVLGRTSKAIVYEPFSLRQKFRKIATGVKTLIFLGLGYLFVNNTISILNEYFSNSFEWFTGKHTVKEFNVVSNQMTNDTSQIAWKELIFNDVIYYNDTFKLIKENDENTRFSYKVDSVSHLIKYKPYSDENGNWNDMYYEKQGDSLFTFNTNYKGDSLQIKTKIKRLEDYLLISQKGRWIIDL